MTPWLPSMAMILSRLNHSPARANNFSKNRQCTFKRTLDDILLLAFVQDVKKVIGTPQAEVGWK